MRKIVVAAAVALSFVLLSACSDSHDNEYTQVCLDAQHVRQPDALCDAHRPHYSYLWYSVYDPIPRYGALVPLSYRSYPAPPPNSRTTTRRPPPDGGQLYRTPQQQRQDRKVLKQQERQRAKQQSKPAAPGPAPAPAPKFPQYKPPPPRPAPPKTR